MSKEYVVIWSGTRNGSVSGTFSLLGDGRKTTGNITDHAPSAKHYDKSLPHPREFGGGTQPAITNWPASHRQNKQTKPVTTNALQQAKNRAKRCKRCQIRWKVHHGLCVRCYQNQHAA